MVPILHWGMIFSENRQPLFGIIVPDNAPPKGQFEGAQAQQAALDK
jgi:hypothetical protein